MTGFRRLQTLFEASLYAIVVIPFAAILFGGGTGPVMAGLFAVAFAASWFVNRRGWPSAEHTRTWNWVILAFVAYTAVNLLFFEVSILDAGIRLVLILVLIKMYSRLGARDDLQVYALSFLMLAAATTVNEGLTFGIMFGLYVLAGTFSLALFHLRTELAERPHVLLTSDVGLNRGYVAVLASISAVILAMSLGIFFTFPRVGLGAFVRQSREGVSVTGFNDSVHLGDHGVLRDDPEVVMRVEFLDVDRHDFASAHWRVMTFDRYDGEVWSRTANHSEHHLRGHHRVFDTSGVYPTGRTRGHLQVYLEPMGTNLLPTLWPTESVQLGLADKLRWMPNHNRITVNAYNDLRHTIESELGVQYVLTVADPPVGDAASPPTTTPSPRYLQLPPMSKRVGELARRVTQSTRSNRERAAAIQTYLERNYAYTTNLPVVHGSPIESFLFDTKRGHCEYFATAMVLLLREVDVPARLVNGFLGGKWNDVGGYLAVRQGDAHAWAEYWDPNVGWRPIDPTPATEPPPPNPFVQRVREYWDAARLQWVKWIVEYDLDTQADMLRKLLRFFRPRGLMKNGGAGATTTSGEDSTGGANWHTWLWVGLALLAIMGVLRFLRRRRRKRGGPASRCFARVEAAARRADVPREPGEGPATFLARLAGARPDAAGHLRRFSAIYLAHRFGADDERPDAELDELTSSLVRRLRKRGR